MGFIIDRHKVKSVRWELDPDNYDLRLHHLGKGLEEFIVVNPIFVLNIEKLFIFITLIYYLIS